MHLIAPLAAGIRGAEDGSVDVYVRDSATRAKYYTSFEGDGGVVPTASLALDENGGVTIYVNQVVDCVVKSADGATVRSFTDGQASANVEVRSQSFTGTDYDDGASAASNPVDLSTVFDRWKTSAGTIDWDVLVGGSSKTLQSAIGAFSGLFFNVKDSAYGAAGNGTADDASAISAAITAATAAGGIVFFPPGTYRLASALVPGGRVSFLGCGPGASIITIDHATANAFTYSTATTTPGQFIRGLRITAAQANTGNHIDVSSAVVVVLVVEDCYIGGTNTNGKGIKLANAGTLVDVNDCTLEVAGNASNHASSTTATASFNSCLFVFPATFNSQALSFGAGGRVAFCSFLNGAVTAGTFIDVYFSSTPTYGAVVFGCLFPNAGGATVTGISSVGIRAWEAGCAFGTTVALSAMGVGASAASHEGAASQARDVRRYYVASDAGTLEIDPNLYGLLEVERTTNGNQALTLTTPTQSGLYAVLVYNNDQGAGGGTITWTGAVQPAAATFAVNANKVTYHWLTSVETKQGNMYWAQYGTLANQSP